MYIYIYIFEFIQRIYIKNFHSHRFYKIILFAASIRHMLAHDLHAYTVKTN